MAGPLPKDPALRQRTNKVSTAATLDAQPVRKRRVPGLPKLADAQGTAREWHPMTRAWWRDVWRSPMAAEYLQADVHALFRLAVLVDGFWQSPSKELAAEIRLQQQCFGLTPIDRRRLQWEMEQDEQPRQRVTPAPEPVQSSEPIEDPRKVLRVLGA